MKKLAVYLLILFPTFIFLCYFWYVLIEGRLYYCTDPVPILGFIPPLVHSPITEDFWIAPKEVVYAIWLIFVGGIFTIPYILVKKVHSKISNKWIVLGSVSSFAILVLLFPFMFSVTVVPTREIQKRQITQDQAIEWAKARYPELSNFSVESSSHPIFVIPGSSGWYFQFILESSGSSILKSKCLYVPKNKRYIEEKAEILCEDQQKEMK